MNKETNWKYRPLNDYGLDVTIIGEDPWGNETRVYPKTYKELEDAYFNDEQFYYINSFIVVELKTGNKHEFGGSSLGLGFVEKWMKTHHKKKQ